MTSDDMALVREYAQSNSEQAFAMLVSRHVNLVYSVALRQVRDPHLAEEITQSVFIILAGKAKSLSPKAILSGWLCRTARYVSGRALRTERRRQIHEQEAQMQSTLNEPDSDAWQQIAPLLDEALNYLGTKEHDAIVLRFFNGKELKQVGAVMGTTEDGARKRVNRGVEKLREFFAKKGVTLSATAITGAVAANSVQAAPAGLAASITAAALSGTTITTAAVIAATKTIAMTTLQKTIITAAIAIAVGTGIYEARQAVNARSEVQTLQQQQAPLAEQIRKLQEEQHESARHLAALHEDNERLNQNSGELLRLRGKVSQMQTAESQSKKNPIETTASTWANRANQVKEWLEQTPEEKIPELQLLLDRDWLLTVEPIQHWEGTNDYKFALSFLRTRAKRYLAESIGAALGDYLVANNGQLPQNIAELKPYFNPQTMITDDMLQRYDLLHNGNVNVLQQTEPLISESGPIQKGQYDALFKIGVLGYSFEKVMQLGMNSSGQVPANHRDELKKLFSGQ